ncbi:uncharacterized protein [Epargyreus clarus]|uniref:uncharacterized protein n=1 Tax=Epargyreus clarus TaxID=520877 RepID=UPI003C2BEDDB
MKLFVALAFLAAVSAAPQNPQDVQILRYDLNNAGLDSYSFAWELSDGSKHEEQGQLRNQGTDNEAIAVQGQYGWVGPDGVTYTVTYIADENGFQPQIQQGPGGAVPSAVVASLLGFTSPYLVNERPSLLKMKLIVALCLVAVVAAAPPPNIAYPSDNVQLLKFENDNDGTGYYRYAYEQTNGQKEEQQGEIKNGGSENEHIAVSGVYSWVGPDGVTYVVRYIADDNGFQPDIEQGPGGAVPAAVLASLAG